MTTSAMEFGQETINVVLNETGQFARFNAAGTALVVGGRDVRITPGVYLPDYLSLSMPIVMDAGDQAAGAYTDIGTDGTGSVTTESVGYGYLGATGVKLTWSSGGTYCRIGDQLAAPIKVGDGKVGVFVYWPGDQGVGCILYLSNDTGWTNYAQVNLPYQPMQPNGWLLYQIAQSEFTTYGGFSWENGIRRFRFAHGGASAGFPDIGFGGLVFNIKNLPIVALSCDDGWKQQYDVARPILDKYGYTATMYIVGSVVGGANYMSASQLQELQNTYGWDIANHGWAHLYYSTLNQAQMLSDYNTNTAYLNSIGANAVNHFCYPYGDCKKGTDSAVPAQVLSANGALTGRLAATSHYRGFQTYLNRGIVDPMHMRALQLGTAVATVANIKAAIDNAILRGEHLGLYFHKILDTFNPEGTGGTPPADGNEYYKDDFDEVIGYLKQKEMAGSLRVFGSINQLYAVANGLPHY